jgi:integrase-like protein
MSRDAQQRNGSCSKTPKPWNDVSRYLVRDQDAIYGAAVARRLCAMGIRDKPIAPGSPWQNGYAERLIGTIRRECDHLIVFGEAHLLLREYAAYYNGLRTHRALNQDAPVHRAVEPIGAITRIEIAQISANVAAVRGLTSASPNGNCAVLAMSALDRLTLTMY